MTTFHESPHVRPLLTPQEAIVRELITDRVARAHRTRRASRRHIRSALLLRRLAARLDPEPVAEHRPVLAN